MAETLLDLARPVQIAGVGPPGLQGRQQPAHAFLHESFLKARTGPLKHAPLAGLNMRRINANLLLAGESLREGHTRGSKEKAAGWTESRGLQCAPGSALIGILQAVFRESLGEKPAQRRICDTLAREPGERRAKNARLHA